MKKGTVAIMGFIVVLILCLFAYLLLVRDGGIVKGGYNSVANVVNSTWQNISGSSSNLIHIWDGSAPDDRFNEDTALSNAWGND